MGSSWHLKDQGFCLEAVWEGGEDTLGHVEALRDFILGAVKWLSFFSTHHVTSSMLNILPLLSGLSYYGPHFAGEDTEALRI